VSASPTATQVPRAGNERRRTESARAALTRPRGAGAQALRLVTLLITLALLTLGWQVVGIDIPKLVAGLPAAQHIAAGLLTPDLVTREVTSVELSTPFRVGEGPEAPAVATSDVGQTLRITPGSVRAGQEIVFEGTGFAADASGVLTLSFAAAREQKISNVQTDASGSFQRAFAWPASVEAGDYAVRLTINAPTGRIFPSQTLVLSLSKMGETILLAMMGTIFGVLISVPLSFFGARNLMQGSLAGQIAYFVVRTIFNLGRSIEVLILAVVMAVVVGIGPYAGMMAIVLHSIGAMGKLYSEAIESIDPGPIEAITATGASRLQTIIYAVVPQVIPQFLSFTMYRWDINVRMSTVVGLVGGGGIGFLLIQYINLLQWSQAATALWLIAIVVMAMDYASAAFRARMV
jgi:phosphonate transport system permease protein